MNDDAWDNLKSTLNLIEWKSKKVIVQEHNGGFFEKERLKNNSFTVPGHKSGTAASVWSKITLITGGVGGAGAGPPTSISWGLFFKSSWNYLCQLATISN